MAETSFDNEHIYKIYCLKITMVNSLLKLFTNETELKHFLTAGQEGLTDCKVLNYRKGSEENPKVKLKR